MNVVASGEVSEPQIPIGFLNELSETENAEGVYSTYARWARTMLGTERATVAIAEEGDTLRLLAIEGNKVIPTGARVPVEGTMIGRVFATRKPELCEDLKAATGDADCEKLAAGGLAACMDAPILIGDRCFGVLAVGYEEVERATSERLLVLRALARCLASFLLLHDQLTQLREMAHTDPLTKAYNRRQFQHRAAEEWTAWEADGVEFSLLLIDLDHFKSLNDTYGHDFGDDVLRMVAKCLRDTTRRQDMVVRMGGEEFCLLLPGTGLETAHGIAERVCNAVSSLSFLVDGQSVNVTVSIGVSATKLDIDDLRTLSMRADQALYKAKNSGRNQVIAAE